MLFVDIPNIEIKISLDGLFLFRFSGDRLPSLRHPRDVGYDIQVRGGHQTVTIINVSLSSPPAHVHRLRRDHHATRIPFGAHPLLLEGVPA
jgi:hypothetical protein